MRVWTGVEAILTIDVFLMIDVMERASVVGADRESKALRSTLYPDGDDAGSHRSAS
jgi:hypothetical protein